jgi:hypothetical protein
MAARVSVVVYIQNRRHPLRGLNSLAFKSPKELYAMLVSWRRPPIAALLPRAIDLRQHLRDVQLYPDVIQWCVLLA